MRQWATEALGKIGDSHAVEPLCTALKDRAKEVRLRAVEALSKIGDWRAIEPLGVALKDSEKEVRLRAVEALSKFGHWCAIEQLGVALKGGDKEVGLRAVEALSKIGDGRVVEPLCIALKDRDRQVRLLAAEVLVNLYRSGSLEESQKRLIVAQRPQITAKHTDGQAIVSHYSETTRDQYGDCGQHTDHDVLGHQDLGIGIDFPI